MSKEDRSVQLGCGTFILIAIIVAWLGNRGMTRMQSDLNQLRMDVRELGIDVQRLQVSIERLERSVADALPAEKR